MKLLLKLKNWEENSNLRKKPKMITDRFLENEYAVIKFQSLIRWLILFCD